MGSSQVSRRPGRRRRRPSRVDVFMSGLGSALLLQSLYAPVIALGSIAAQIGVSRVLLLGASQAAAIMLAISLWRLVRRGGMPPRRGVVVRWLISAAGLAGLALTPASFGEAFVIVALMCMGAVGAGSAVTYAVQANQLVIAGEAYRGGGAGSPTPEQVAARIQIWASLAGVLTGLAVTVATSTLGWRQATGGLAVLLALFAIAQMWCGVPPARQTAQLRTVRSLVTQAPDTTRTLWASAHAYGVWQQLYSVPALLGASPLATGLLAGVPRIVATLFARGPARAASRAPATVLRAGASCVIAGTLVLGIAGSHDHWIIAGGSLCFAEPAFTIIATALKGAASRRGDDPVRHQLLQLQVRYLAVGLQGVLLSVCWWYFHASATPILDRGLVIVTIIALAQLGRLVRQATRQDLHRGKHVLQNVATGELTFAVLPSKGATHTRWIAVLLAGAWQLYRLAPGEQLRVHQLTPARPRVLTIEIPQPRLRPRRGAGTPRVGSERNVPLANLPGLPHRATWLTDRAGLRAARMSKTTDDIVTVTTTQGIDQELNQDLREKWGRSGPFVREVELGATHRNITAHLVRSVAFNAKIQVEPWTTTNRHPQIRETNSIV